MDLSNKTLAELRAIAREKGLKGVTALRKPELAARIAEEMQQENDGEGKGQTAPKPVKEAQGRDTHRTESGKRMAAKRESQRERRLKGNRSEGSSPRGRCQEESSREGKIRKIIRRVLPMRNAGVLM